MSCLSTLDAFFWLPILFLRWAFNLPSWVYLLGQYLQLLWFAGTVVTITKSEFGVDKDNVFGQLAWSTGTYPASTMHDYICHALFLALQMHFHSYFCTLVISTGSLYPCIHNGIDYKYIFLNVYFLSCTNIFFWFWKIVSCYMEFKYLVCLHVRIPNLFSFISLRAFITSSAVLSSA